MLRLFTKQPDGTIVRSDPVDVGDVPETGWRWLDVTDPTPEEIVAIGTAIGLYPVNIEDVLEPTQHPKVDVHEHYVFAAVHALAFRDERVTSQELDVVLLDDLLVTFHRTELPAMEWVIGQAAESPVMADGGVDRMFGRLAEAVVRRYLPLVQELDERIDELEERAVLAAPGVVEEVLVLRRDAIVLRRVLTPTSEVAATIADCDHPSIGAEARRRFSDVTDHATRAADGVDTARVLLGSVLDTHRSTVAERTNEAMQTLTVFAAILLPLSLIAGIYGMNFARMPELDWEWAYFATLGLMAAIGLTLWVHFARRGLIGRPRLRRLPGTVMRGLGQGVRGVAEVGIAPIRMISEIVRGRSPNTRTDTYNADKQGGSA
jgi:magnesium transporter